MARTSELQRLSMRNVASAHQVLGEFGAAEEGPSELLVHGSESKVRCPMSAKPYKPNKLNKPKNPKTKNL